MMRTKQDQEWYGRISYLETNIELKDPADVENSIRKGAVVLGRWLYHWMDAVSSALKDDCSNHLSLSFLLSTACSSSWDNRKWIRNQRWPYQFGDRLPWCAWLDAHWPARYRQGGCWWTAWGHRGTGTIDYLELFITNLFYHRTQSHSVQESCSSKTIEILLYPGYFQIKDLIHKFIKKQETISLVVVPANVDIATTEALKMAQEVDPWGERTLGECSELLVFSMNPPWIAIWDYWRCLRQLKHPSKSYRTKLTVTCFPSGVLTKPDLVDEGCEELMINTVNNLSIPLKKGYMVVKCRGQKEIIDKVSFTEALKREDAFFRNHTHFQ